MASAEKFPVFRTTVLALVVVDVKECGGVGIGGGIVYKLYVVFLI